MNANPTLRQIWTQEYTVFSFMLFRIAVDSIKMKRYDFARGLLDYLAEIGFDRRVDLSLRMVLNETFTSDEDREFLSKYK